MPAQAVGCIASWRAQLAAPSTASTSRPLEDRGARVARSLTSSPASANTSETATGTRWRSTCPMYCTDRRSEEHTSELQSLMRISYAVFCLKKQQIHMHHTK